MAHWKIIILICLTFIFVEAKRAHRKRDTKSHLCDPAFNNTNKIQCYCNRDTNNIVQNAECFVAINGVGPEDPNWDAFKELKDINKLTFTTTTIALKYIPQHALKNTPNILKFDIKYGNIEVIQPYAFANLSNIKEITLSDDQIKILKVNAFAHHKNLETIGLDMNAIVEINRDVFIDLPSLEKLFLTSNKITTIHDRAFVHLTNLKELEIDRNNLFSLNSETFSGLSKLERLDLNSNSLEVIGDKTFLPLRNLRSLNLEGNKIQMLDTKAFNGLTNLRSLSLAHNALSDIDNDKVFEGLKSLTTLSLKGNQLQSLKPEVMAPILSNFYQSTSGLDVEDNNFPCSCQLDWFVLLRNKTQSSHLKLTIENLKCTPDQETKDKWTKAAEAEKNIQEEDANAPMDYEYYDDTQLNGKLFYVDMRYLLNCSDTYNGELLYIPNMFPTVKSIDEPIEVTSQKPQDFEEKPKIDTTPPNNLVNKEPNIYTTTRLATVSAKPVENKIYDEKDMASDEGRPEKIKAHRSIQDEVKEPGVNGAKNNAYSVLMLTFVMYLRYILFKY